MTDVLIVVVTIALLAAVVLPQLTQSKARSSKIDCVSMLKQVGLCFRIWSNDNSDKFPWQIPRSDGGTAEFADSTSVFLHFLAATNELSTTKILACEKDTARTRAANWNTFNNQNLSYLVGLTANESNPQSILTGDRNLTTNGTPLGNGVFDVAPKDQPGWSTTIHKSAGNIGLADGSVQQFSITNLQKRWQSSTDASTNLFQRIAIP